MKSLLIFILLSPSLLTIGQSVGISETNNTPHPGAVLDVKSTTKGVLLPRTSPNNISNPAAGMIIYDLAENVFKYYTGTEWRTIIHNNSFQYSWADQDSDGFGTPHITVYSPTTPPFYVNNDDDCDDTDPNIHPGVTDVCDGIDNNCNGSIDESCPGGFICCGSSCVNILNNPSHCGQCGFSCEDGFACTINSCSNGSCITLIEPGKCFISGACFNSGQANPNNPCQVCNPNISQTTWSNAPNGTFCPPNGACVAGTCVQF